MASLTGLCAKIINVICFNYMFICGEIQPNFNEWKHQTSFANFYGSMIQLEFFGTWYNVLAPLLILILGIIFSVFGVFKYNSKTVEGLLIYDQESTVPQKNKSFIENVLTGEKAILKEYESLKNKTQRKQFNSYGSILGSFSGESPSTQPRQGAMGKSRGRQSLIGKSSSGLGVNLL